MTKVHMVFRFAARLACAAGFVVSLLAPGLARADDDPTIEMARQRFREGVQFYDQRQYEKARLAFLQAYALKPHPSVLLNLAQSELRADRPEDAANHFAEYLRGAPQGDAERQEAESGFLVAKAKTGEITVTAEPAGAQVMVDGQDKGAAPLAGPVYVVPGSHTIELRSSERKTSKVVVVGAGQATAVSLSARAAADTAPVPSSAPPDETDEPSEERVTDAKAEVSTSGRRSLPDWFAETPLAWIGTGVALAGFATGGVFAGLATREYATANEYKSRIDEAFAVDVVKAPELLPFRACQQPDADDLKSEAAKTRRSPERAAQYDAFCGSFRDHADKGDQFRTFAIIGTAVGGAALIGTVVYYFVDAGEAPASAARANGFRARLVPGALGTMQGLTVVGQF